MLRRALLTCLIFFVLLFLLMLPVLIRIYVRMSRGGATGIGFVRGSLTENLFRVVVLLILAMLAYWLSGKFLRL